MVSDPPGTLHLHSGKILGHIFTTSQSLGLRPTHIEIAYVTLRYAKEQFLANFLLKPLPIEATFTGMNNNLTGQSLTKFKRNR